MSHAANGDDSAPHHDDDDGDAILAELEAEADKETPALRQARLQSQVEQSKAQPASSRFSSITTNTVSGSAKQDSAYTTLKSDDATLQFTTEHDKALVHFFHPEFARCAIMDAHLETIAANQADFGRGTEEGEVHLGRVDVSHAPFVVEKMGIRVLPCVIGFVKGVVKGRIVGFEGLCWDGKEKDLKVCRAVEERLVDWGLLRKAVIRKDNDDGGDDDESEAENYQRSSIKIRRGIQGRKQQVTDENDDWD